MRITILNGNPDPDNHEFDETTEAIAEQLRARVQTTEHFLLREMKISYCTGCWGCWVKTPGECVVPDDTIEIRKQMIHSDFVLYASPIIMGYTSALMKMVQDKSIPLLHPYIELVNKECHHEGRYSQYPKIGLLFQQEPETTEADISLLKELFERYSINFKSELVFFEPIGLEIKTIVDEIIHSERITQG
jgi:multimeric flavodoxin WrbA